MADISEGIQFRRDGIDPSQWPKLNCSAANELALEVSHLILDGDRSLSFRGNGELSFHGNGQLKVTGDLRCFTGNPATEKLTVLANGNIGIGTKDPTARLHIYSADDDALKITNTTLSKTCRMGVDQLGVWIEPSETNSSIRLNANPSLFGLYIRGTDGNVGIGTSDPKARLDVIGDVQAAGRVSTQNGQVRRDFIAWSTTERRSDPIHIKTNIPKKSNIMYRVLVEGYNYGMAAVINSDIVGYTYAGWETIGQAQANNYANGVAISQYYSSDGYVVIKLTTGDTYYLGFVASAWFTNPNGTGFDIAAKVSHQAVDL